MPFIQRLGLQGLLSFPPDMEPFDLQPLNVLIGPNGAGKTNVIEALELLHAAPTNLAEATRSGGGIEEWVWKGDPSSSARISVELQEHIVGNEVFLYVLEFGEVFFLICITDERIEKITSGNEHGKTQLIYHFNNGSPVIEAKDNRSSDGYKELQLDKTSLTEDESILSQIKEPSLYPDSSWIGGHFRRITIFREWTFGGRSGLRLPQRADDPSDALLPDARNLARDSSS